MNYTYKNITLAAPTTTTVKSERGTLHAITVNKTTANGVITVYDGVAADARIIATITSPATLLQSQFTLFYDVDFSDNLTIVTSTGAQDLTVSFN